MSFTFNPLALADVVAITPQRFEDERGHFAETFRESGFEQQGLPIHFPQHNYSYSTRGVLRGLHYQLMPSAQGKLVRVISGTVYDAVVDLRRSSSNFGKWVGLELSAERTPMLYVPEGFAHGFCVTSDEATVAYMCTSEYAPDLERGIIWNDAELGIDWPTDTPVLSDKDTQYPLFRDADYNFD